MNSFHIIYLTCILLCCGLRIKCHISEIGDKKLQSLLQNEKLLVEQKDIYLIIYNKSKPNTGTAVKYEDIPNLEKTTSYNNSLKSVVYIHGWLHGCNGSSNTVRNAFLTYHEVNFFELCWEKFAFTEYFISRSSISNVAKYFSNLLAAMVDAVALKVTDLTIVGHSLGAHIAGVTSQNLNKSVGVIVGLDPAGPAVFEFSTDRLTADSAIYVQAIHTDSSFLGLNFDVGNADFWPNGGRTQRGCNFDIFGRCSHLRAIAYYTESVSTGNFFGRLCENYDDYSKRKCNVNLEKQMAGYPSDTSVVGNFYLDTHSTSPYALGHHDP